jgi:hypothetical protein
VKLAYADPPYPGQAKRHYGDHPDYGGEVDHRELIAHLAAYDGWALSTSAAALQEVLAVCPAGVRLGVWNVPNSNHPGNRGCWWWSWEAVIVRPARPPAALIRDVLTLHIDKGFIGQKTIIGQKPEPFCRWLFALLGAEPDDELNDLFPGSGAVGRAWEAWRNQLRLAV